MLRKIFIVFTLLCVAVLVAWRWLSTVPSQSERQSSTPTASASAIAAAKSSAVTVSRPSSQTSALEPGAVDTPSMPAAEIARVVESHAQPGRMAFVDFQFTAGGIAATHAVGAMSRAKPGPVRTGAGYLQFEVYSAAGDRTLVGSIEDPLHQRLEYEDETQSGVIRTKTVDRSTGSLRLRLPGESDAARVIFFRETAAGRETAGAITLR